MKHRAVLCVVGTAAGLAATAVIGGGCGGIDPQKLDGVRFAVAPAAVWLDGAPRPVPAAPGETRVIVTNNLDDTVSVLSLARLLAGDPQAEVARFGVGLIPLEREGPHHVAVDATGRTAFVGISNFVPGGGSGPHGVHGAGTADGRAVRIDLDTHRVVATNRVDRNPGDIRLTPDGRALLLTHFDLIRINDAAANDVFTGPQLDARLAILDPLTLERRAMVPLCPAAHGMAITRDSRTVVTSCISDEAAVVDLVAAADGDATGAVRRVALLDAPGTAAQPVCSPYAVTLTPDDRTAWVSCYRSGALIGVDVATATRTGGVVELPGLAVFGSFARDGVTMAVATQDTDGVVFVVDDGAGHARRDRFVPLTPDLCELPHTTAFVDDDRALLVVCEGNKRDPGAVIALDVASGAVLGRVEAGIFPDDLALAAPPVTP